MDRGRDATALAEGLLVDAYEYVLSGWCQGAAARDECGRGIEPASAFARAWSVLGGLERAWRRSRVDAALVREAFERAKGALTAVVNGEPQSWNDRGDRDQNEVLSALAEARDIVAAAPAPAEDDLLGDLVDDLDHVGHRLAVQDALFEGGRADEANPALQPETRFEP
jgi:hypothetical protein